MLSCTKPDKNRVVPEIERTLCRKREAETGEYDFESISRSIKLGNARVDAPDYIVNTDIKQFGNGRASPTLTSTSPDDDCTQILLVLLDIIGIATSSSRAQLSRLALIRVCV